VAQAIAAGHPAAGENPEQEGITVMKQLLSVGSALIVLSSFIVVNVRQPVQAHELKRRPKGLDPVVFQAAGPTAASIQSMVDAFRTAIGGENNGNVAGPIDTGRREINWDGGGSTATSIVPTPFDGFLVNRGGRFTTRGDGFVQAPVEGLAATFNNTSYATEFKAFSPVRLFSPLDSNVTTAQFFVPGGGEIAATTKAFGAVFSDVDQQRNGDNHGATTVMLFYGAYGNLLYRADVPASEGEASFSFVGVLFDEARVASVRIRTGNALPGADDNRKRDVVMMDDFIYGEPRGIAHP
jgi:hypothetical protein